MKSIEEAQFHTTLVNAYHISPVIRVFSFQNNSKNLDPSYNVHGSRSLGLFRKSKTHIIAKFHGADLAICSHSKVGKTPSYSQINMVLEGQVDLSRAPLQKLLVHSHVFMSVFKRETSFLTSCRLPQTIEIFQNGSCPQEHKKIKVDLRRANCLL